METNDYQTHPEIPAKDEQAASVPDQTARTRPVSLTQVRRGRPRKYATEEERRRAKNEAKRMRRRQEGNLDPTPRVEDEQIDWRARQAAREAERRREQEEERFAAQFRNDFGNQHLTGPEVRSAADVIVDYLTSEDNYNAFKLASTAEKKRMIGDMQEEMGVLGMDSATRSFSSIWGFISRLVRDCSRAHALENHTGEGLSDNERLWIQIQRIKGKCNKGESDLEAFIRLKYPLWVYMKDVLSKRPAFNPLDMFDSGKIVDEAELDEFAKTGRNEKEAEVNVPDKVAAPSETSKEVNEPAGQTVVAADMQTNTAEYKGPEGTSGTKRPAPETENNEGQPPTKIAPRPRRFTKTRQAKIKPATSVIAEILRIQKARDRETEAMQDRQDELDESWFQFATARQKREARLEEMQKARDKKDDEDREERRRREKEDEERRKAMDERERKEEERREKRFQQEMDEKRIRLWLTLRGEFGDDRGGRMVWGKDWDKERNRFQIELTNGTDQSSQM